MLLSNTNSHLVQAIYREKKFGFHRLYKICLFSGLIYFKQFSHYKCFKISFVGCFYDSAAPLSKLNDKCLLGLEY